MVRIHQRPPFLYPPSRALGHWTLPRPRARFVFILIAIGVVVAASPAAAQTDAPEALRVFLDCNRCDSDYLRTEITFVNYVRDRRDAQVHVLVATESSGGGGRV